MAPGRKSRATSKSVAGLCRRTGQSSAGSRCGPSQCCAGIRSQPRRARCSTCDSRASTPMQHRSAWRRHPSRNCFGQVSNHLGQLRMDASNWSITARAGSPRGPDARRRTPHLLWPSQQSPRSASQWMPPHLASALAAVVAVAAHLAPGRPRSRPRSLGQARRRPVAQVRRISSRPRTQPRQRGPPRDRPPSPNSVLQGEVVRAPGREDQHAVGSSPPALLPCALPPCCCTLLHAAPMSLHCTLSPWRCPPCRCAHADAASRKCLDRNWAWARRYQRPRAPAAPSGDSSLRPRRCWSPRPGASAAMPMSCTSKQVPSGTRWFRIPLLSKTQVGSSPAAPAPPAAAVPAPRLPLLLHPLRRCRRTSRSGCHRTSRTPSAAAASSAALLGLLVVDLQLRPLPPPAAAAPAPFLLPAAAAALAAAERSCCAAVPAAAACMSRAPTAGDSRMSPAPFLRRTLQLQSSRR